MSRAAAIDLVTPIRRLLNEHLEQDAGLLPVLTQKYQPFDHVNVQVAIDAYLREEGRTHQLVGVSASNRHFQGFADLIQASVYMGVAPGPVDFTSLPSGPDSTIACVGFGLFLIAQAEGRLAVLMRGPGDRMSDPAVFLEIVSPNPELGQTFLADISRLMHELNVFRGQVISFGESHLMRHSLGPMLFHRRPEVRREQLVLPKEMLQAIEIELLGVVEHRARLTASGQHLKRGLLLYGPPGCGKTLTIRYLLSALRDHTVILMTGEGLGMLSHAASLARNLQPGLLVLEDIDLVAQQRSATPDYSNPLLFALLNEMDGIREDADVSFILTTNRADLLETALAQRPGRVDLAVEIGLPDEDARRRLIELYGAGMELPAASIGELVTRTEGVAASFIKELMRKSALVSAVENPGSGRIVVSHDHILRALEELEASHNSLTRKLLGGAPSD